MGSVNKFASDYSQQHYRAVACEFVYHQRPMLLFVFFLPMSLFGGEMGKLSLVFVLGTAHFPLSKSA
ncbi:uncharacterized protein CLUP02_00758 [Colletotrichum lupini]|uniref:Uncharacterized protein n=1 Tax=Colletotrichum lupini TaxID=145971 RepID=A0A9Q8SBZ6_9PEZI|nr:uncharacterized protein CLUP02_00758 [Colletotrichum lupini]UQC74111.1 hypothetical protein CLUP02_00758 [Colletotrichum lupini]